MVLKTKKHIVLSDGYCEGWFEQIIIIEHQADAVCKPFYILLQISIGTVD